MTNLKPYHLIQTGSKGNAIIYHGEILVDVGVSYRKLKKYLPNVKIILLTHEHKDHFQKSVIENIAINHPNIVFMGGSFLTEQLESWGITRYFTLEPNVIYTLLGYDFIPVELKHDVKNFGYKIIREDYRIFHATDTRDLFGIVARDYDLYAIEFNYCDDIIFDNIEQFNEKGKFPYMIRSLDTHQSYQKAERWLKEMNTCGGEVLKLHMSSTNARKEDLID